MDSNVLAFGFTYLLYSIAKSRTDSKYAGTHLGIGVLPVAQLEAVDLSTPTLRLKSAWLQWRDPRAVVNCSGDICNAQIRLLLDCIAFF